MAESITSGEYPTGPREAARLAALERLRILDTPPSASFDRLCRMACELFGVPIVLVSLLDENRQWFKARCGLKASQTPRDVAFCNYTALHDEVFVVPDALADRRFADNPLVLGEPYIRFYAGAPLTVGPGIRLGSFCLIDREPREFSARDVGLLKQMTRIVVDELWLHHLAALGMISGDASANREMLDFSLAPTLTGAQVRAARGLLNWSVASLATAASVSVNTIKRMEASDKTPVMRANSIEAVTRALAAAGVELVFSPGHKPGVRPADRL